VKRKSKRMVMVKIVKSEDSYGGRWPGRVKGVHLYCIIMLYKYMFQLVRQVTMIFGLVA
jgi:hypothetical protein